ncbi:DUF5313 family protein [Rhodococcoides yunnanense]|uniref:DUF5313 family protein n=1 Tax=Rhodococcoides yunnanense TaxID=278209 RepID=UPI000933439A|nr:DUF5313 family protein [Rhodococcus yunnanensis]
MTTSQNTARPNFAQWFLYSVFGKTLPNSMQDWVRRDLVGPRAVPRHLIRGLLPFTPIFVAFLVLFPGPLWLRGAMVLLSVLLALFYTLAFMDLNRARRLELHGLSPDLKSDHKQLELDRERASYERRFAAPQSTQIPQNPRNQLGR